MSKEILKRTLLMEIDESELLNFLTYDDSIVTKSVAFEEVKELVYEENYHEETVNQSFTHVPDNQIGRATEVVIQDYSPLSEHKATITTSNKLIHLNLSKCEGSSSKETAESLSKKSSTKSSKNSNKPRCYSPTSTKTLKIDASDLGNMTFNSTLKGSSSVVRNAMSGVQGKENNKDPKLDKSSRRLKQPSAGNPKHMKRSDKQPLTPQGIKPINKFTSSSSKAYASNRRTPVPDSKLVIKIQSVWKGYKQRKQLISQGVKLPDRKKLIPMTKDEEICYLRKAVKELKSQVAELTIIKNQHEEALSYLFEQVTILRNKTK